MERNSQNALSASWIKTPIEQMIVVSSQSRIHLLEFANSKHLQRKLKYIERVAKTIINQSVTKPIISIKNELQEYFDGALREFNTPIAPFGTNFQNIVWKELMHVPYGKTRSYKELANNINMKTAYRAVALANSANNIAIVIPCHRIINNNGNLGGYSGGIQNKQWLLNHEQKTF